MTTVPVTGQFRSALSSVLSKRGRSRWRQVADTEKEKARPHWLFGSGRRALPVRNTSFERTRRFHAGHPQCCADAVKAPMPFTLARVTVDLLTGYVFLIAMIAEPQQYVQKSAWRAGPFIDASLDSRL